MNNLLRVYCILVIMIHAYYGFITFLRIPPGSPVKTWLSASSFSRREECFCGEKKTCFLRIDWRSLGEAWPRPMWKRSFNDKCEPGARVSSKILVTSCHLQASGLPWWKRATRTQFQSQTAWQIQDVFSFIWVLEAFSLLWRSVSSIAKFFPRWIDQFPLLNRRIVTCRKTLPMFYVNRAKFENTSQVNCCVLFFRFISQDRYR